MQQKYVDSIIGDAYKQWAEGDKVLISAPTGSGKTTFVISKLLRYAVEQGKHIIYYCNRKVLHEQVQVRSKEDIERFFANEVEISETAANYFHILTYQSSELTENYPDISIKDSRTGENIKYQSDDILYYIFDEAHYFVNDALINVGTNFWYTKKFAYGISVFLTATPKPLITLFASWDWLSVDSNSKLYEAYKFRSELTQWAEVAIPEVLSTFSNECKDIEITAKTPSPQALIEGIRRNSSNPLETRFQALDQAYQSADAKFKVYTYEPDYSYIDPVYFMDLDEIIPEIRKDKETNEKWLIFVDDERQGTKLASRICFGESISSVCLSSATVKRKGYAREVYDHIVLTKTFPVKVLVATSVMDCGIDIKSTDEAPVRNVVIASDNETTFLQMLGRRRVNPGERIRLYIKTFDYQTINNRYNQCIRELHFLIKFSLKNDLKVIRKGNSTVRRDGNTYGSTLSAGEQNRLIDDFLKIKKSALVMRREKEIVGDCNGHVKWRKLEPMTNLDAFLKEFEYSRTAFVDLVCRLHDYRYAMSRYRSENENFVKLCDYAYKCLELTRDIPKYDLNSVLYFEPNMRGIRLRCFPFLGENKPAITEIDCRSNTERDREFFLRHQLSWIGKEYDINCWLGFEGKYTKLTSYLDSEAERDRWLRQDESCQEQFEFSRTSMKLLLDLPVVPNVLLKDRSRYTLHPETFPGKDKLNKCFKTLSLPYTILSEQRRYEGRRKTCWKLVKIEEGAV